MSKKEYTLARNYLKAAEETDPSGTFGDDAKTALSELDSLESAQTAS